MKSCIPHDGCKGISHNIMESDPLLTLGGVTKREYYLMLPLLLEKQ